jgi:uncharacterized membrane protein YhaH (DUF805 family)
MTMVCNNDGMSEGRIFISYRRSDSQGSAGRLFDRLLLHFERDRLFMDVDAIEPGVDFVEQVDKQLSTCSAFIAVIGPDWLDARTAAGRRRLDDPADYVRIEIESALKRQIRVIPVLVDDAPMPQPAELPPSLEPLSRRNAVEIAHHRFAADCDELAAAIKRALGMSEAAVGALGPAALPASNRSGEMPPARPSWPEILFSFRGRVSRKQFVLGALVVVAMVLALIIPLSIMIEQLFLAADAQTQEKTKTLRELLDKRISTVAGIAIFWPSWALILKRLHDIGQGWIAFLAMVALDIAATVLDLLDKEDLSNQILLVYLGIVLMLGAIKGVQGPNEYGPDPLPPEKAS